MIKVCKIFLFKFWLLIGNIFVDLEFFFLSGGRGYLGYIFVCLEEGVRGLFIFGNLIMCIE